MQHATDYLNESYLARTVGREVTKLQLAMTELLKVVESLLPEPDPEPEPEPTHPSVARIKFADGGIVISGPRGAGGGSDPRLAELRLRHNAELDSKNDLIRELEARIANQRKELDHLNAGRSLRNKELEARIEELEVLAKAPASAINQFREELTGQLLGYFQKSA